MSSDAFTTVTSKPFVLEADNIDTDQIIPARFLTTTSREGLGAHAFHDWRFEEDGSAKPDAVLNEPWVRERKILVAGNNFGCGSSREHAPWALLDYGFKVVISTEIADIFRNNSLKNGLLTIVTDPGTVERIKAVPDSDMSVDLEAQQIGLADGGTVAFTVDPFARHCLLQGTDQLGFLLAQEGAIDQFEARAA